MITRRDAIGVMGFSALGLALGACRREQTFEPGSVALYSSVDEPLLQSLVAYLGRATGLRIAVVGDTEATKTTGLVQRLIAERDRPRCDVWWSNEPFGTIGLARQGLLAPMAEIAGALRGAGWPAELIGADDRWIGFAQRARAFVSSTERVADAAAPTALSDLLRQEWRGRIGMARPQFGTTRGHVAALVAAHGADRARAFLAALKANEVRMYDGNSMVVRAVAQGEIDAGLTDTDDVFAGQRNGWKVRLTLERADTDTTSLADGTLPSIGPLVIPNTVAIINGAPNQAEAARLVAAVVSEDVERLLAESEARNIPVRPGLASKVESVAIERPMPVRLEEVEARVDEALAIAAETLGV